MDWNGNAKYYKEKQHESHESKSTATFVRFGIFVVKKKQHESNESHEL